MQYCEGCNPIGIDGLEYASVRWFSLRSTTGYGLNSLQENGIRQSDAGLPQECDRTRLLSCRETIHVQRYALDSTTPEMMCVPECLPLDRGTWIGVG